MAFLTVLALILFLWGVVTLVRRIAEGEERDGQTPKRQDAKNNQTDGIDWEEMHRAEEEVRDLGADARPEDGFEGDDWGPGAPRKPPLV
jgi:hypothetical protein